MKNVPTHKIKQTNKQKQNQTKETQLSCFVPLVAAIPTTPPPCVDTLNNCASYAVTSCAAYRPWALDNCRKYCGYCGQYLITHCLAVFVYCSRSTYTKIGTIQRRLAWPLRKGTHAIFGVRGSSFGRILTASARHTCSDRTRLP